MKPFFNELLRSGKSIVILITVVVLVIFLTSSTITATEQTYVGSGDVAGGYYFEGGAFHFLFYVYNLAGEPISVGQVSIEAALEGSNGSPTRFLAAAGQPGGSGLLSLSLPGPSAPGTLWVNYSYYAEALSFRSALGTPPPTNPAELGDSLSVVDLGTLSTVPAILAFAVGPGGTEPVGYAVDYSYSCSVGVTGGCGAQPNITGRLGTLASDYAVFPFTMPHGVPPDDSLSIFLQSSNGSVLTSQVWAPGAALTPSSITPAGFDTYEVADTIPIFFLWPLVGVIVGFVVHGRSRIGGFADGSLVRPMTRVELLLARFGSAALWTGIPALAAMGMAQASIESIFHLAYPLLPLIFVGIAIWAAMLTWVGLTMLVAQISRTSTAVVVFPVSLYLLFAVGWSFLPFGPQATQYSLAWPPTFYLSLLNPTLLPELMAYVAAPALAKESFPLWNLGIGALVSVAIACAAWVLLPLGGAIYTWLYRD